MEWHGNRRHTESRYVPVDSGLNSIQARMERAQKFNLDFICKVWDKKVKDMTDGEVAALQFFLEYHPDPYSAIEGHKVLHRIE